MSTKHALVILAPNGRRHTVNVTQNTSIQEVLEIVCKKHDLDFNEWDLKHYNRIIELANSVRFSGLPNNASLEMVQSTKPRKETTITLVLQLETGKRLKHEFASSASLWEVLLHWQNNGEQIALSPGDSTGDTAVATKDDIQPVCIYMRQEIVGEEQLQKTSLRSLGLTHGAACIRLIHRSQNQLKHQANISAPLARPTPTVSEVVHVQENDKSVPDPSAASSTENTKRKAVSPSPLPQSRQPDPDQENPEPMEVEHALPSKVQDGANAMGSLDKDTKANESNIEPEYIPPEQKLAPDGQLNILGEHDACLYYSGDVNRLNLSTEYDESFYEITKQDVQRRQRDLRQMREEMENAPLQTAEARELQRQEFQTRVLAEHPWTIIRVRFPNRYILQGIFRTDDTIGNVAAFVRKYLADPALNFYLLITPPRTILFESNRLIDQNLIGSAVIYFGCDLSDTVDVLKPELYDKLSCPNAIREHTQRKVRSETTASADSSNHAPESAQRSGTTARSSSQAPSSSSQPVAGTSRSSGAPTSQRPSPKPAQNSGVVPKWFKK